MEDVLDVYQRPYNSDIPVVCMDEKPYQLLGEKREPLQAKVSFVKKTDSEYIRNGTCSIFMFVEALGGVRYVEALNQRTKIDFAHQIKKLLEVHYPDKERIILVMDNLNTHNISSLYEAFEAQVARSLAKRLEIHHTPVHGSWLNIAEIELSALTLGCLGNRIPTLELLNHELFAWQNYRNLHNNSVNWQFTTDDARSKLKRLYPKF